MRLIMSPLRLSACCLLLGVVRSAAAIGGEAPNPKFDLPLFTLPDNANQNYRNDFCNISYQVLVTRELTLDVALNDVVLHTALMEGEFVNFDYVYADPNNASSPVVEMKLNEEYPGLVPLLLDAICERAGCKWRDTYTTVSYADLPEDKTFLELLLWTTDVYDFTADWWMRSVERLRAGVTFTEQWYDATIIMVSKKKNDDDKKFDAWGWVTPFDEAVWLMTIVTVVFSSVVYWLLQKVLNPNADPDEEMDPVETTWAFATAFAGQFEFEPQTAPARVFTFSIAIWGLLMTSAYTANLASFLVIRNKPGLVIQSLQQAVKLDMNTCVWRSSQTDVSVTAAFPDYAKSGRLLRRDQRGVFEGLRNGDCAIAITEVTTWDVFQHDEEINGDCSLEWIGRPFRAIPASFGFKGDAGLQCTSFLRDEFNFHLHDMETDGTIQALWDKHIQETADVYCSSSDVQQQEDSDSRRRRLKSAASKNAAQQQQQDSEHRRLKGAGSTAAAAEAGAEGGGDGGDTTVLTLIDMGGVFLFHGIISAAALLLALVSFVWNRSRHGGEAAKMKKQVSMTGSFENGDERVPSALAFQPKTGGSSLPSEEGQDDLNYFDAMSRQSQSMKDVMNNVGLEELRTEMHAKLGSIEDKLACLLLEKKKN